MSELFIQLELNKRLLLNGQTEKSVDLLEQQQQQPLHDDDDDDDDDPASRAEYLDATNDLHFEFSLCPLARDLTQVFTVYICAYDLRRYGHHSPFVLHLLQFDGQKFDFPKFSFQCAVHDNDDSSGNEIYFKNQCWTLLSEVFADVEGVDYRGFLTTAAPDIFVFFDTTGATNRKIIQSESLPRVWASMDEIMNQHQMNLYPRIVKIILDF
jgi:hypothetical protein